MRGQAALEFLTTYGWAIMVVLVAVAALAYFGVFNPSGLLPNKCIFDTGVSCIDYGFDNTITFLPFIGVMFSNGQGVPLQHITANVSLKSFSCPSVYVKPLFIAITDDQMTIVANYSGPIQSSILLDFDMNDVFMWDAEKVLHLRVGCQSPLFGPYSKLEGRQDIRVLISATPVGSSYAKQFDGTIRVFAS
ncbi:MAG: hypothetical protein V1725_03860 [archaeon]